MTEEWRPIPGHPGYEASSLGQVRSVDRVITTCVGKVQRYRGRILVGFINDRNRRRVMLGRLGTERSVSALVLEAFVGPRPAGHHACHGDGNSLNDALTNLRWGTPSENILDQVRHGTHNQASKTYCPRNHVLTEPNLRPADLRLGKRVCLACSRGQGTRGNARKRGEVVNLKEAADMHYARIMAAV